MLRQLALLTILLAIPASVAAHGAAFSIVEINKESGTANPVFDDASPTQLTLPKEYAPKSYVVGENITFSADLSDGGQWDFGDGSGGMGETVKHTYKRDAFFPVYVILRATDKNGVFVDAFATLDTPLTSPNPLENLIEAIKEFFANLFAKQS